MSAKGQDRSSRLAALSVEPLSDLSWQRIERRLFADGAVSTRDAGRGRTAGRDGGWRRWPRWSRRPRRWPCCCGRAAATARWCA